MDLQVSTSLTDASTFSSSASSTAVLEPTSSQELLQYTTPTSPINNSNALAFSLKHPLKKVGKNNFGLHASYMTYEISIRTSLPQFEFSQNTVRRRFNDFVQLHQILRKQFRGCFIPPLPDKYYLEARKQSDAFVRVRMADLEKFISLIGAHPELGSSHGFVQFLSIQGDLGSSTEWNFLFEKNSPLDVIHFSLEESNSASVLRTKSDNQVVVSNESMVNNIQKQMIFSKFWGSFKRIKNTLGGEFQSGKVLTEFEIDQRNVKAKLVQAEKGFSLASKTCEAVVNGLDLYSQACQEFCSVMMRIARFEEQTGDKCGKYTIMGFQSNSRAADYQRLGYGVDKVADTLKKYTLLFASKLIVIQDQLATLPEAIKGLHDREFTFHVMEQIRSQLSAKKLKQAKRVKALSSETSNFALREKQQEEEIINLENKLGMVEKEYAVQNRRNLEEIQRYFYRRERDLDGLVFDYVNLNVQMNNALQTLWMNIAEQFQTFTLVDDEELDL